MILIAALAAPLRGGSEPRDADDLLRDLRVTEVRLARAGSRLAAANAPLCKRVQPETGFVLHALDSYAGTLRTAAQRHFAASTNIALQDVLPGSPAEAAGFHRDDAIVAINDVPLGATPPGPATTRSLIAFQSMLAALPAGRPIRVAVVRNGRTETRELAYRAICSSRFELKVGPDYAASSDGEMVQIGTAFLAALDDDELAVLLAHELAHNILDHPRRLRAQNVSGGLFAGFGRNVAFFRQTETQADILSVSLLANAGYPPQNAPRFWRTVGQRLFAAAFTSRSHPSWRDRAATTAAETAKVARTIGRPVVPEILASRDKPLDGNWQAILIRAGTQ